MKKLPRIKRNKRSNYSLPHEAPSQSLLQKLQSELQLKDSYLSLFLGFLIVLVVAILVFNYFKQSNNKSDLGPAQQTASEKQDVLPENLPGKYTVKEGDTLFSIAEKYYQDGYKFPKIAEANKLADANILEIGQVLEIPKLAGELVGSKGSEKVEPTVTEQTTGEGTGGAVNQTIWGEKITGDTYTVVEGDWLSKIAGRAYGDIMAYPKIAEANNIANPDLIEPGMVLKIPR